MQLLAGLQIELVDRSRDGLRRSRTQGLRHGPERFLAVRRLDDNQPAWIETEAIEPVSMQTAMFALPVIRCDKDNRMGLRQTGKAGHQEAESSRQFGLRPGNDLVQRGSGEATLRQAGIERGKSEGEPLTRSLRSGQQTAQFLDDHGLARIDRKYS
jgi:hypothetical protein